MERDPAYDNMPEEEQGRESIQQTEDKVASIGLNAPNPYSPASASFETTVRFLMSFLFTRAPMRVSGVPQSPYTCAGFTHAMRAWYVKVDGCC